MKDSQFYGDKKEESPDCLEDFSDGDLLIQEILKSFENFDRVLGITVQDLFSSELENNVPEWSIRCPKNFGGGLLDFCFLKKDKRLRRRS